MYLYLSKSFSKDYFIKEIENKKNIISLNKILTNFKKNRFLNEIKYINY